MSRLNTLIGLAVNGTPQSWQPTWFANQLIKFYERKCQTTRSFKCRYAFGP